MNLIHKEVQFEALNGNCQPKTLAVGSFGLSGSGKTAFLCTMPGKIGIVSLDDKTRDIVAKHSKDIGLTPGKILFPKDQDYLRYKDPLTVAQMPLDKAMEFYTELKLRVMDAVFTLVQRKDIDSIGFDEGDRFSKLCLMSNYGRLRRIMPRDRGPYNEDMDQFFNAVRKKNCVVTHKAKEIWKGPENNRQPSGKYEWTGHNDLDYAMDVVVEHRYHEKEREWSLSINRCNHRPDLLGEAGERLLEGVMVNFKVLFARMWPESDILSRD